MNIDLENEKFNEDVYNILQIKLPLFFVVCGGHEVNFLMSSIYVHQGALLIFSYIKFNYLNRTKNELFQTVFDFITFSIVT